LVDLSGYRGRTVHALHKKYGPVVRLAPNELSFSALPCISAIYGSGSTCIKSPAYDNFGREGMFQMQEPERHRRRQKRIAHIFAPAVLQQMEPLIQGCVAKLVAQLRKRTGKEVDALHWCRMTVLDVGGESGWGGGPAISQMATYPLEHADEIVVVSRWPHAWKVVWCPRWERNGAHVCPASGQRLHYVVSPWSQPLVVPAS
jgi:hypothetical protein